MKIGIVGGYSNLTQSELQFEIASQLYDFDYSQIEGFVSMNSYDKLTLATQSHAKHWDKKWESYGLNLGTLTSKTSDMCRDVKFVLLFWDPEGSTAEYRFFLATALRLKTPVKIVHLHKRELTVGTQVGASGTGPLFIGYGEEQQPLLL